MVDTIYKTFRANIMEVDEENGIIDMLIPLSTGSIDRDGEAIEPSAFKKSLPKFRKRPILMSSHDYRDLTKQIGEFVTIKITDEGLLGKPKYYIHEGNPEADWAFRLAAKGMAAFSVGFIPLEYDEGDGEKTPKRTYTSAELLEVSQVTVPSNRDAIQGLRGKVADPIITKLFDDILADKELVTKPEETDEYIRIPVSGEAGKHDGHRIRTINISEKEGIKALYCGECKVVITYLFAKDHGWTMASAREWVKEHEKDIDPAAIHEKISQAAISDELDYINTSIAKEGLNEDGKVAAWEVVRTIMGITGSQIPDDIKSLLLKENKAEAIQPPTQTPITKAEIIQIVKGAITEAIAKAQGKV